MTVHWRSFLIIVGAFCLFCVSANAQTLSVCDVLSKLSTLAGKDVAIRGQWGRGDTGDALTPLTRCEDPVIRQGWRFFDWIDVVPDSKASMAPYYQRYFDLIRNDRNVKVVATLTGTLEVMDHFKEGKDFFGKPFPSVFRGVTLARLKIRKAEDFEVVPFPRDEQMRELSEGWGNPLPVRTDPGPAAVPPGRAKGVK